MSDTTPLPPEPPAAPAAATWGQGTAPVAPTKRKTGTIVIAAALAVGVLGGGFGLLNSMKGKTESTTAPASIVGLPDPTAGPAIPDAQEPAPLPGPAPAPAIITTTVPDEPEPAPQDEPAPVSSGDTQAVGGDISVGIPAGWEVTSAEDGYVLVSTDGAEYRVLITDGFDDAQSLANAWVDNQELQDVQINDEFNANPPSASVVSSYLIQYQALLVTQQGGSIPVESIVLAYITQDGTGVVVETTNEVGDFDGFSDAYNEMTLSVEQTL